MQFNNYKLSELLEKVNACAVQAGDAILKIYNDPAAWNVKEKIDDSPLTAADIAAHHIICDCLEKLTPEFPVLSEESEAVAHQERLSWNTFWLVDPLDGTKEFVSRTGEFTVNIALIHQHEPVLGVVYVPVTGVLYFASQDQGAFKTEQNGIRKISVRAIQTPIKIVASRRHGGEQLGHLLKKIERQFGEYETTHLGSSLKICILAEGGADLYPRLGPTSEWDTAAAAAILRAAGGELLAPNYLPMRYNESENIVTPAFYAVGDKNQEWGEIFL